MSTVPLRNNIIIIFDLQGKVYLAESGSDCRRGVRVQAVGMALNRRSMKKVDKTLKKNIILSKIAKLLHIISNFFGKLFQNISTLLFYQVAALNLLQAFPFLYLEKISNLQLYPEIFLELFLDPNQNTMNNLHVDLGFLFSVNSSDLSEILPMIIDSIIVGKLQIII